MPMLSRVGVVIGPVFWTIADGKSAFCVGDGPIPGGLLTISAVIVGRPPGIVPVPT